jgi:hypothetical protein
MRQSTSAGTGTNINCIFFCPDDQTGDYNREDFPGEIKGGGIPVAWAINQIVLLAGRLGSVKRAILTKGSGGLGKTKAGLGVVKLALFSRGKRSHRARTAPLRALLPAERRQTDRHSERASAWWA